MDSGPTEPLSPPMTVAEALTELHEALSTQAPSAPSDHSPAPASSSAYQAPHALDSYSPARARARITRAIAALRSCVSARGMWGAVAERVSHKRSDAARHRQHRSAVRNALIACRDLARREDAFAPPHDLVLHRTKVTAENAGAQTVEGLASDAAAAAASAATSVAPDPAVVARGPPGPLLTVCGAMFLADFQFYEADVTVHFRHLAGDLEVRDPEVDMDFARLVREEDISALQDAFETLVSLETLDAALRPAVALKESLRRFEDALLRIHQAELAMCLDVPRELIRDRGHGLMERTAHGLSIVFANGWSAILGVEDVAPPRRFLTSTAELFVSPKAGSGVVFPRDLPAEIVCTGGESVSAGAQYILRLLQPVCMTRNFAASLEREVSKSVNGPVRPAQLVEEMMSGARGATSDPLGSFESSSNSVFLEALLVPSVFGPRGAFENAEHEEDVLLTETTKRKSKLELLSGGNEILAPAMLPDGSHIKFSYARTDCSPGITVRRVPIYHPSDALRVVCMLRQQLVFNALFSSCFASHTDVTDSSAGELDEAVEVVICDAPSMIHLAAFDPLQSGVVGIAVNIGRNGTLDVRLRGPNRQKYPCPDSKATALLEATFDIPIALQAIRKAASLSVGHILPDARDDIGANVAGGVSVGVETASMDL